MNSLVRALPAVTGSAAILCRSIIPRARPGRCPRCGRHIERQGHEPNCAHYQPPTVPDVVGEYYSSRNCRSCGKFRAHRRRSLLCDRCEQTRRRVIAERVAKLTRRGCYAGTYVHGR